jgi:hypothetical protein
VIHSDEETVVVLPKHLGDHVTHDELNGAYLRLRASGARRGLVVTPGFLDLDDVRRREVPDPAVLHCGPEGIQRMADAVAAGADPLRFAATAMGWNPKAITGGRR